MVGTAVLLDLDGTVWDSRPWYAKVIARLSRTPATEFEIKLRLDEGANVIRLANLHGVSRTQLAREAGKSEDLPDLYGGVLETLSRFQVQSRPMAVVSNLSGSLVAPLLRSTALECFFGAVVTPNRGVPAKPQPHGVTKALRTLGIDASKAWYIGDGDVDAKAAGAAGVRFAWASYGYEREEPAGTDVVIEQFEDALRL